jgi:hypothetical protein
VKIEENIKNDEHAIEETAEEKSEGGLKVKTSIKAGPEIQVDGGGG